MTISLQNVLWPTDFSDLALKGGRHAFGLCRHFGARLHIIHVIAPLMTPDFSTPLPLNVTGAGAEPDMLTACRESLRRLVDEQFAGDPQIVVDAFFANPWAGICKYATDKQIDLIVVTTHGRTGLEHAIIGSTAERIVQHAPCAVLTLKNQDTDLVAP
ncbi:MAG: universal stress protein [Phycisphaerae bacterium]|jgi:nucleotide-binding universal stress UspA family protein